MPDTKTTRESSEPDSGGRRRRAREFHPDEIAGRGIPGEATVWAAAERSLSGQRTGMRGLWPFLGPAFIASIAYVDPGNFATNVAAGSTYGYTLLWVILGANLMAMLIQSMSAKLGIATGRNLPEACSDRYSFPVRVMLWLVAEVIAMATDLAEFIGAAVGLNLIFGIPLLPAALITSVIAFGVLALQQRGFRHLEAVIVGFVLVIVAAFAYELVLANADWGATATGLVTPKFIDTNSVLLACGILGATVMPHVIYLHSALTQHRVVGRTDDEKRRIFRFELVDVVIAMGIAGLINMSMLVMAAGVFHSRGMTDVADLDQVFEGLKATVGGHAHLAFGIALLASGLSSSSIGTYAGQVVMQGFIRRSIPLFVRRGATMAPAILIIAFGVNASAALIASQVVLSFGIPFALIPLLLVCRDKEVMGVLVNRRSTTAIATVVVALIVCLNVFLLVQTVGG